MDRGTIIVGAGPAGLTAAYELVRRGAASLVLEKGSRMGGISRTEEYRGYRFDIGGHRFFTKVPRVEALWHEIMGPDFLRVPRLSRIYYEGKFYDYPLNLWTTLRNLGPVESVRMLASYLRARVRPLHRSEENFEQWVSNRFGERLYRTFFQTYTEKVWGLPCTEIRAEWAAQRIRSLSPLRAVLNALFRSGDETSLIREFHYPRHGPGMMWDRFAERVREGGGEVRTATEVVRVRHQRERFHAVVARSEGSEREIAGRHLINTMPIRQLVERLDPAPPARVLAAARRLAYRDLLLVALVVDRAELFEDNWIYVHSPEVRVGRIQNFKNWSADMVPDPSRTCLGMEYFCSPGDDLYGRSDAELVELATRELARIGLAGGATVVDGTVVRQRHAYPVYDEAYAENLATVRAHLAGIAGLQTVGRAGMHRYNNQDHSMLTAMLAVENLFGAEHDVWEVNVERSYHEEFQVRRGSRAA